MSQIQGRVLDSSIYGWVADVAITLTENSFATVQYVDDQIEIVDSSITSLNEYNNIQDSSISLKADITYVDSSLAIRDASITNLNQYNNIQDSSISLKANITYVDSSLAIRDASITNLYSSKQNTIPDSTFLKEVSIGDGLVWNSGLLDVSIAAGTGDVTKLYVDGSLAIRDTSIDDLNTYNNTQDTSIGLLTSKIYVDGSFGLRDASLEYLFTHTPTGDVTKLYVDGSLAIRDASITNLYNTKQNTIPDSTFLKEVSIGDGLVWNSGMLDVSVAGGGGGASALEDLTDVSISDISTGDALMFNEDKWYNMPTVDISTALLDSGEGVFVKEASIGDGLVWNLGMLDVSIEAGAGALEDLTDVSLGTLINNQVVSYDTSISKWTNKAVVDVSLFQVVDASEYFWILKDTSINYSTISNDQTLAYQTSTSKWVNKTLVDVSLYDVVDASDYIQPKITFTTTPPASNATGVIGDWVTDASYLYVCNSTNKWGRIAYTNNY